jgi:hypothetical protein
MSVGPCLGRGDGSIPKAAQCEGASDAIHEKQQPYEWKCCFFHILAWMREVSGECCIGNFTEQHGDRN